MSGASVSSRYSTSSASTSAFTSPGRTAREVRARFRDIDRRLAEVETFYVTSNPRLSAEIERLR